MPVRRAAAVKVILVFGVFFFGLLSSANTQTIEPPWTSQDVGNPSLAGSATGNGTTFSVEGSGVDIWGTSDQFHFVYQPVLGDAEIIVRVDSLENTDTWAKAGVMLRESLNGGSKYAFVLVSADAGAALQWRSTTGGLAQHRAGASVHAPYWVRLQRTGNTIRAYGGTDGASWTLIGSQTISMNSSAYVGLAVTSTNVYELASARFSGVRLLSASGNQAPMVQLTEPDNGEVFAAPATISLTATASDSDGSVARVDFYSGSQLLGSDTTSPYTFTASNLPAGSYTFTARAIDNEGATASSSAVTVSVETAGSGTVPVPWASQDIGTPSLAGNARYDSSRFIVEASGADIWGTSDQFHFVYQPLTGDGEIVARVDGIVRTDVWAKAGVMMRETLTAGSKHVYALRSAAYGTAFQRRVSTGGSSTHTAGTVTSTPWLRLTRQGSTFRAYESADGASWRLMGSATVSMASTIYVGLAVTAHTNTARTTGTFSGVEVSAGTGGDGGGGGSTPYGGSPAAVPGTIQAENFDLGTSGVAYRDNSSGNSGGVYRSTDVDIESTSDSGGGYNVAWVSAGEWLNYTVNVASSGSYTFEVRAASPSSGGTFHLEANGSNVSGTLSVPNTGGWQTWRTVTDTITLSAGVQTLRLVFDRNASNGAVGNFNYFRLTSGSSNTPPTVTITAPANGATYAAPATMTVSASASDSNGSVTRVDFYAGSTLIGSDTTSPYSIPWSNVAAGSYSLTARATDNGGATSTSNPVTITVGTPTNQAPNVSLTNPPNSASIGAPMFVPLTASASDADGSVTRVDFYVGSTLVGSDTSSPYSVTWNLTSVGTYTLTARATDNDGATRTSSAVTVTVTPTLAAFVPPADHATGVTSYLLEIFTAGSNPSTATPVRTMNIGKPSITNGEIRVDVSSAIQPLAAGNYFATVSAVRSTGSMRSSPSGTFAR